MKIPLDKKYLKYSLYTSLAIIIPIAFFLTLHNISSIYNWVMGIWTWLRMMLSPFIIGAFAAYIINPGVRWFEEKMYGSFKYFHDKRKAKRLLSIATVYLILFSFITMLVVFVVPQISNNVGEISRRVPDYVNIAIEWIEYWTEDIGMENIYNFTGSIEKNIRNVFNTTGQVLDYLLNNILYSIIGITSGVLNFVLGFIISFYMLADKESFKIGIEKFLRLIMKGERVEKIKDFGREADDLFAKFIVGKSLDSFIIGFICFTGLKLMKIKYSLLLSVIVGITNMIPYFGPFIGGVPVVIITFFDSPMRAFWVAIFIFALQQFDGMILGPKILGDSVGLRPIWIIFSIIVGGKLAGVLGMFLGVPICAILRSLIISIVDKQLERKNIHIPKDNHI